MEFRLVSRLREGFLSILRATAFDFTIAHHWTGDRFRLNSYRHKGYWFHGKKREFQSMDALSMLVQPGDCVVEAGGHIGYLTLWFSHLVGPGGQVIVFEPGSNNLPYLRRNVREKSNVSLIEQGCGSREGVLEFFEDDITGQNNSFIKDFEALRSTAKNAGGHPVQVDPRTVSICRIDQFVRERGSAIAFVKIDTEGFEVAVLEGCVGLFHQETPPKFMVEVQAANRAAVFAFFSEHGYQVFDESGLQLRVDGPAGDNLFMLNPRHHHNAIDAWSSFPRAVQ